MPFRKYVWKYKACLFNKALRKLRTMGHIHTTRSRIASIMSGTSAPKRLRLRLQSREMRNSDVQINGTAERSKERSTNHSAPRVMCLMRQ